MFIALDVVTIWR